MRRAVVVDGQTPAKAHNPLRASLRHDSNVVAAAWDADDASMATPSTEDGHRSIVVERTSPIYGSPTREPLTYDPFDEDHRIAQLPEDPFDDPFDEPESDAIDASETEPAVEDSIDEVESAIEQEIQRRRMADELIDDDPTESLEVETPDVDPLDELQDEAPLSDDPADEELLQSENDDWQTPDFDLTVPEDQELTPEELRQRSEERQRERQETEDNCREEIEKIEADTISSIDLSIRVPGNAGEDFPYECSVSTSSHQPRQWPQITYNWKASAICHKPLYFEQVQLERYGHSWGPYAQPIMSGVHFFSSVAVLPYKMGIRTPNECVYTLGYYRPGSCAPYMIDPVPFTWRAAMFQGAVATGIPMLVP